VGELGSDDPSRNRTPLYVGAGGYHRIANGATCGYVPAVAIRNPHSYGTRLLDMRAISSLYRPMLLKSCGLS
jgi:hypothetical protein